MNYIKKIYCCWIDNLKSWIENLKSWIETLMKLDDDDDEEDDDDNHLPWRDDVSASGYPPLIMSEPPLVYIFAASNTWPPATPGPIGHIFVRATPFTR